MKKDSYYSHPEFRDVFFQLLDITEVHAGYKVRVVWWNKGQEGIPYPINIGNQEFIWSRSKCEEFYEVSV